MFRKLNNPSTLMVLVVVLGGLALAAGSAPFVRGLGDAQASGHSNPGIVATLPVGGGPDNIRAIAATNRIYVSNFDDHTVSIIDGISNTVITKVTLAGSLADRLEDLEVGSSSNLVYVIDRGGTLSVFDGATNTDTLLGFVNLGGERLDDIVFTANNRVYINHGTTGKVTVFDDAFPLGLSGGPVLTLDPFQGPSNFIIANAATDHVYCR